MSYSTRQSSINFPKRKSIISYKTQKASHKIKQTVESKVLSATSAESNARKAFHGLTSGKIIGREKEIKQLTNFFFSHLENQNSGSIYISGLPGTGKTAVVNFIIEEKELARKYKIVKINCTAFNSSKEVYKRICEELKLKTAKKNEKESLIALENYLLRNRKMILLILDEIDQLESKLQSVLYKIFEWPWKNSRFVLVGIANAMDLTDRNLPRLCTKVELKPVLLHFPPYTKDEIADILKNRLTEVGIDKIFAPGAVELLSAKVAGTSGDVRRALDLGKRVIDIAEKKNQEQSQSNELHCQQKINTDENNQQKLLKRKIEKSPFKTPPNLETLINEIDNHVSGPKRYSFDFIESSPKKVLKNDNISKRVCLSEIAPQKTNQFFNSVKNKSLMKSAIKAKDLTDADENDIENFFKKLEKNTTKKIPVSTLKEDFILGKSPEKLQFDVDSKDVLTVVKSVLGPSKNFKPSEESCFPLHQKLLICTLLLILKKGKKKDLNVGKLHQVYSKICVKRGLTAVDKSGFLFLCRQVEMTGVVQIGKGPGSLAKLSMMWDESEVANSLKDFNMLNSILNDTSCLNEGF